MVAIAGVEKAREAGVLMLEELEHQATDRIIRSLGNIVVNRLGKMRRHVVS